MTLEELRLRVELAFPEETTIGVWESNALIVDFGDGHTDVLGVAVDIFMVTRNDDQLTVSATLPKKLRPMESLVREEIGRRILSISSDQVVAYRGRRAQLVRR